MAEILSIPNRSPKFHFDNKFWDSPKLYEEIKLYQIGDLYCNGGYEIGEHVQQCYEISYIVCGEGYYFTDGNPYRVRKGDIHVCLPGQRHNYIADKIDPFRFFYIGFDFADHPKEVNSFYHIQKMFDYIKNPIAEDQYDIYQAFMGIFRELINGREFSSVMVRTFLKQIIILSYRSFFEEWQDEYAPEKNIDDNNAYITYQIINYIDTNLLTLQTLSEIGDSMGYSYSYISHIFTRETGLTVQEYFNQRKFEKAIELLKQGDITVTKIAEELNYQSVHSFSKAFKKNIGVSPIQYQELYMNKMKLNG